MVGCAATTAVPLPTSRLDLAAFRTRHGNRPTFEYTQWRGTFAAWTQPKPKRPALSVALKTWARDVARLVLALKEFLEYSRVRVVGGHVRGRCRACNVGLAAVSVSAPQGGGVAEGIRHQR